ncbi:MAG: hypothetical protein AAGG50_14020, partial [Bacteroidota bacterium]
MRRLLLPALLFAATLPASAQNDAIPNASFDVWNALDPVDWLVTNDTDMNFRNVDAVGNARSGPFAA